MQNKTKIRIVWTIGSLCIFHEIYLICRYEFFEIHGMSDWPFALFIFGLIVLGLSSIFYARRVMLLTPLGYILGFITGALFNVDNFDEHGSRLNNFWIWWTIVFLIFIVVGLVWEIIYREQKVRKQVAEMLIIEMKNAKINNSVEQ